MSGGVIEIGWLGIAGAAALILVNAVASILLGLGLEKKLAIASVRTVVQLLLLGYLLVPVFALGRFWLVAVLSVAMIAIAARESLRRAARTYRHAWIDSFGTLFVAAVVTAVFGSAVLVGVEMSVVGVVSIPGMMTGQLLGGTTPEQAARYQILILFMIAATVAMGTVGAVLLGVRRIFDDRHRLRSERILHGLARR